MDLVELLQQNGVIPVLVFDGQDVPIKANENKRRTLYYLNRQIKNRERKEQIKKAKQLEEEGCYQDAYRCYSNAIDITPEFYTPLIEELIKHNISYIIAPYEADVELAYLSTHNLVDLVITQDSDSLVYGCSKVLFKMNKDGEGDEICHDSIFQATELSIRNFTPEQFQYLCILSGCDYLANPPQLRMKRLCPYVKKGKTPDRILQLLQLDGGIDITQELLVVESNHQ